MIRLLYDYDTDTIFINVDDNRNTVLYTKSYSVYDILDSRFEPNYDNVKDITLDDFINYDLDTKFFIKAGYSRDLRFDLLIILSSIYFYKNNNILNLKFLYRKKTGDSRPGYKQRSYMIGASKNDNIKLLLKQYHDQEINKSGSIMVWPMQSIRHNTETVVSGSFSYE